jgi:hypothetical protein
MDCEENEKCKLHTIIISYQANGNEPKCTYYYGDEDAPHWPMTNMEILRLTKRSLLPRKPDLIERLISFFEEARFFI